MKKTCARGLWIFALGLSLACVAPAQTKVPLVAGFDVFKLGMPLTELKAALKNNSFFLYEGDPDVTLLSRPNTSLIDVPGITYFSRGVFQLLDGTLYSITLELNPVQLDYFAMYTTLSKKYGDPVALDPSIARWETPAVRLTLERPLTVKYLDMPRFVALQKSGTAQKALQNLTREKFLENF
ncbi:MAG: hypothetical protein WCG80_00925 [Spirochaetales bacterium]